MELYEKVSILKRLPTIEDNYDVVFFEGTIYRKAMTVNFSKAMGFYALNTDCSGITHWYELRTQKQNADTDSND